MNNLSGVWSKANETKHDPFSKIGPTVASGTRPWQPGSRKAQAQGGGDVSAGLEMPHCHLLLTVVLYL